ncbi:hypothetical protein [Pseudobacteriovorax antillogorgiicola]|uniref:Uncharacterized protein n=1 Tax=Pseudobacteriovorax antillogorgiicola TaxID=1513793 RepID=A0A1Y6CPC4_9BACT|nr:hypothetical protein [Pseudobacteriovorax antillogorgiicola]TCS51630.1 hypothetical protein EDD56_11014 [Pseudobacteriovorax antillogorgiicola]SMF81563.1 hypothetical protein SAMN06296036_13714 [Pseudobacteriovorax antillogorgiicola]
MKTYREQLGSLQEAIAKAEQASEQDLEVNGNRRRKKSANLDSLYRREAFLIRMIEREDGGSIVLGVPK